MGWPVALIGRVRSGSRKHSQSRVKFGGHFYVQTKPSRFGEYNRVAHHVLGLWENSASIAGTTTTCTALCVQRPTQNHPQTLQPLQTLLILQTLLTLPNTVLQLSLVLLGAIVACGSVERGLFVVQSCLTV